jgi:hypothetical protein
MVNQKKQADAAEQQGEPPKVDSSLTLGSLRFDQAGDSPESHVFKGLVYGQSGAGKSWLAATAPSPFIMLTEENGRQSIRQSNPKARVVRANDIGAVREFLRAAAEDRLRALGCQTIVIDSLTEVQRLMKDEILAKKPTGEGMALQDWGELTERMRRFMRMLRDVPYNVVATALEATSEEDGGPRNVFPSFEGKKLHNEVAQYFNFVGYVFKKEKAGADGQRAVEHAVMLEGPSRFLVKPCSPLTGVLQGPMGPWFDRLTAGGSVDAPKGAK